MVARPSSDAASLQETLETTLGDLVSVLYDAFLEEYGDEELAALATSTLLTERFADTAFDEVVETAA